MQMTDHTQYLISRTAFVLVQSIIKENKDICIIKSNYNKLQHVFYTSQNTFLNSCIVLSDVFRHIEFGTKSAKYTMNSYDQNKLKEKCFI